MKFLIADPHPGVRSALSFLLSTEMPSAAILQAGCRLHLLEVCAAHQPDCILMDPFELVKSDPDTTLTETGLVRRIRERCPGVHLVGMSSRLDSTDQSHRIGMDRWIQKTDSPDVCISAIFSCLKPGQMDR